MEDLLTRLMALRSVCLAVEGHMECCQLVRTAKAIVSAAIKVAAAIGIVACGIIPLVIASRHTCVLEVHAAIAVDSSPTLHSLVTVRCPPVILAAIWVMVMVRVRVRVRLGVPHVCLSRGGCGAS